MSSVPLSPPTIVWRESIRAWLSFAAAAAALCAVFHTGIAELWRMWGAREEYSFGYFIPLIAAFLIWQRKDHLKQRASPGSWAGFAFVIAGAGLRTLGDLSASTLIVEYGFLIALWGAALAYLGWAGARVIAAPLAILVFMIPLPEFLLIAVSQQLQLLSSQLGVALIRACDISVYLEGNVIDLGVMKLQVVEACSGLRYLFPLMGLAFVASYLFKAALWKRLLVFLSSVPITVLLNSLRIALIGVTVEYWGRAAAEGLLHDFEGVVIFIAGVALLVAEMWLLTRFGRNRMPFASAFRIELPGLTPPPVRLAARPLPAPFLAMIAALIAAAVVSAAAPASEPVKPSREDLGAFPLQLGEWQGHSERLDPAVLEILKPDDYLLADYATSGRALVNLFIGYFAVQTRDSTPHSPRVCLPGAGWDIVQLELRSLPSVPYRGSPLRVNRAVISRGDHTQIVYYWLQSHGRVVTHEYAAKLYIFWDAITANRTDGAIVRLITPSIPGEGAGAADERLTQFAAKLVPRLPAYLPD
jgi:exosortase D (VPLPA-CTERM-specific)